MSLTHPLRQGIVAKTKPMVDGFSYVSTTSVANFLMVGTDTGLKDLSANNWAFANVTNVSTTTAATKNNPIAISASGNAWLTLTGSSGSAEFNYGTGDFTWESWIYFRDTTTFTRLLGSNRFGGSTGFFWQVNVARIDCYVGATAVERAISPAISTSTWHHLALSRKDGTVSWYIDGTRVHTQTVNGTGSVPVVASIFDDDNGPGRASNLYVDEMRHVKGVALYQGEKCPVPTAPLTTSSLSIAVYSTATSSVYGVNQLV
jgi:hypothetical protein